MAGDDLLVKLQIAMRQRLNPEILAQSARTCRQLGAPCRVKPGPGSAQGVVVVLARPVAAQQVVLSHHDETSMFE